MLLWFWAPCGFTGSTKLSHCPKRYPQKNLYLNLWRNLPFYSVITCFSKVFIVFLPNDVHSRRSDINWSIQNRSCEETIFHGRRRRVSFRCSINKSAVSLTTAVGNWCMGIYIVPIFIAHIVSITVASLSQGGLLRIPSDRDDWMGAKIKSSKNN